MSKILAKMTASTARDFDKRAAAATDPAKRAKLTAKADKAWREVRGYGGDVPPGRLPEDPAPAPVDTGVDAVTTRLPVTRPAGATPPPGAGPSPTGGKKEPSTAAKIGVGFGAALLLFGGCSMLLGGGDDEPVAVADAEPAAEAPPVPGPDPAPEVEPVDGPPAAVMAACQRSADIIGEWNSVAENLGSGANLDDVAAASDQASRDMADAALGADDPGVTAAMREAGAMYEQLAAAARRFDTAEITRLAGESGGVFQGVVSACQAAVLGS
ncbi:hypothetical protein [Pseudonocardia sp. NPDC049635]|uniref:hypothetical protein n=1 Tax=Pseudonocardia sp. NPDC049635 TaxID=3155506 RepID=UPI0033F78584